MIFTGAPATGTPLGSARSQSRHPPHSLSGTLKQLQPLYTLHPRFCSRQHAGLTRSSSHGHRVPQLGHQACCHAPLTVHSKHILNLLLNNPQCSLDAVSVGHGVDVVGVEAAQVQHLAREDRLPVSAPLPALVCACPLPVWPALCPVAGYSGCQVWGQQG